MDQVLRIAKWQEVFERAESRKLKSLNWVAMPTSFSSNGYQAMLDEFGDDADAVYGAWCALVAFAASCPNRGVLASSKGTPVKVGHIARITGLRASTFEKLIQWAVLDEVAWLIPAQPHEIPGFIDPDTDSGESPDASGESPEHTTRPDQTEPDITKPNQTDSERSGDLSDGRSVEEILDWFSKVDLEAVRREAVKLDRKFESRAPARIQWELAWMTVAWDSGFAGDMIATDKSQGIKKPKAYFEKCMARKCDDFGVDLDQVRKRIRYPKLKVGSGS